MGAITIDCGLCAGEGSIPTGIFFRGYETCPECNGVGFHVCQTQTPKEEIAPEKVKSNGASSSYYELPEGATELRHLIQEKNMDFAVGNIFKACYRLGEKHGTGELYDIRKIIFFGFDELEKVSKEDYRSELERFREFIDKELLRLS